MVEELLGTVGQHPFPHGSEVRLVITGRGQSPSPTGSRNLLECHAVARGPVSASPSPTTQATEAGGNVTITTGLVDTSSTPTLLGRRQIDVGHMITHRFAFDDFMAEYDLFAEPASTGARSRSSCRNRTASARGRGVARQPPGNVQDPYRRSNPGR